MNGADGANARRPAAVRGLDEQSRALVREEVTARSFIGPARDQDLPTTEPDVGNSALMRARDSVLAEVEQRPTDRRTPALQLISERTAPPTPTTDKRSDVFAPTGAKERVLDADAATPRDRPLQNLIHQRPTEVDRLRAATTTVTFQREQRSVDNVRRPRVTDRFSRERESDKDKLEMKSVYESEHSYHQYKNIDEKRAEHIVRVKDELKKADIFNTRDLAIAMHSREKRALDNYTGDALEERRDRVMALGLLARELDDKYREQMRALEKMVTKEFRALDEEKQERVYEDFDSFTEDDRSNDSNFCRKELNRALKDEVELHRAYIYALALEKQRRARESAESSALKKSDLSGSRSRR